jgi:hypothetical protein
MLRRAVVPLIALARCTGLDPGGDRTPLAARPSMDAQAVDAADLVDAGAPRVDATPIEPDAAPPSNDAAATPLDAGLKDAGLEDGGEAHDGGSPWNGTCAGYANTIVLTAAWVGGIGWVFDTDVSDPFGDHDMIVVRITPSSIDAQARAPGSMNVIEYDGPPAPRWGSLSDTPCDLTGHGLTSKRSGSPPVYGGVNAPPGISIWVGANQPNDTVRLLPGVTYYYNITNQDPATGGTDCSPGPVCDVRFTLFKPAGT